MIISNELYDKVYEFFTEGSGTNIAAENGNGYHDLQWIQLILKYCKDKSSNNLIDLSLLMQINRGHHNGYDGLILLLEHAFHIMDLEMWRDYPMQYFLFESNELEQELRQLLSDLILYPHIRLIKRVQRRFKKRFYSEHLEMMVPFIRERGLKQKIFKFI